mmetsp:Transcript_32338/g.36678  ORF Transcript_32338/g.36678 Transcript_32338/m.36678 type:complete len:186 (+) Transcript_32338:92-649(+)
MEGLKNRPLVPHSTNDLRELKILVVGEGASGKTSILKTFTGQPINEDYEATIGMDFYIKEMEFQGNRINLNLWDISGHPEFFETRKGAYQDANGIMAVYDITSRKSFEGMQMWIREGQTNGSRGIPILACGNKCDLEEERAKPHHEAERWANSMKFKFHEISAKESINIEEAFATLIEACLVFRY